MQELSKQASWSDTLPELYYYRSAQGKEVDFVLENRAGKIIGVEVKATSSVSRKDFAGLIELKELTGSAFVRGDILYKGEQTVPFGDNLFAVPVNAIV